jgi:hypothetical protein
MMLVVPEFSTGLVKNLTQCQLLHNRGSISLLYLEQLKSCHRNVLKGAGYTAG